MTADTHDADPGAKTAALARIRAAHAVREALRRDPRQTAYRLFHGHGEGVPGLHIDRLGDALVVTHGDAHASWLEDALDLLGTLGCPLDCVVARTRGRSAQPRVVRGAAPEAPAVVLDNGLRFEVDPLSPGNPGLYLDARPARAWLTEGAADRRVLNLFAFTGSLGIAAAAGGAKWVLHVELQKRALRRLKRNGALNGLRIDDRDLLREDLYRLLPRLARQGRRFDGIILDPPPQVPGREAIGQDYPTLVPLATALLAPGAWLLCSFSRRGRARAVYEQEIRTASPVPLDVIWRGTSGEDFPEEDPEAKLRFTAFALRG